MSDTYSYPARPPEIEEPTNRWLLHPIGDALMPMLLRLNVHPNTVSIAGMLAGLCAAWFYYDWDDPWRATAGFAYMIAWHVLDGVDGKLARVTGKVSPSGKVIDGICDYVTNIAVYVSISLAISAHSGPWIWWYSCFAGAAHIIQSAAYERQRELYLAWMTGAIFKSPGGVGKKAPMVRIFEIPYHFVQKWFDGEPLPDDIAARLQGLDETERRRALIAYREYHAPIVRSWSILCLNYRTVMIWLACMVGIPAAYFAFQIVVMNGILIALLIAQRRTAHEFNAWMRDTFLRDPDGQDKE